MSKKILSLIAVTLFVTSILKAQCSAGKVAITLEVSTDSYAEEGYWQLVPQGNACSVGTILSGGNTTQLTCSSGGTPVTSSAGNGYANNTTIIVPDTCLTIGSQFDIKYIDDYGDGGFTFKVKANGYTIAIFTGSSANSTFTFTAKEPYNYDLATFKYDNTTLLQKNYVVNGTPINLKMRAFNWGKQTITSLKFNYQINGGSVVTNTLTGLNIPNYKDSILSSSIPFSSTTNGTYTAKMWFSDLNGSNIDSLNTNDTTIKVLTVGNDIPNIISTYIGYWVKDTTIVNSTKSVNTPVDVEFHPNYSKNEMWVVNRSTEANGGTSVIVTNPGMSNQTSVFKEDANNWHFMSLPSAIAMSDNENFANSPSVFDANHNGGAPFTGPALWTSDLSIYGAPALGNGNHLDMLHESPYSQGIAWEKDNVFWVFDGYNNDIVRYDFARDHHPGMDDHSDGIIRRYKDFTVAMDPNNNIPSHMVIDKNKQWLYIVDNGNKKIMRINIQTGNVTGAPTWGPHETVHEYSTVTGYTYETVVSTGLDKPCGIDVIDNRMVITDYATNEVIFYDITNMPAVELYRVKVPNSNGIMGIKIGPDGKLYIADYGNNRVLKLEPTTPNAVTDIQGNSTITISPNPANNFLFIKNSSNETIQSIVVYDATGRKIATYATQDRIDISTLSNGQYLLSIQLKNNTTNFKFTKK